MGMSRSKVSSFPSFLASEILFQSFYRGDDPIDGQEQGAIRLRLPKQDSGIDSFASWGGESRVARNDRGVKPSAFFGGFLIGDPELLRSGISGFPLQNL